MASESWSALPVPPARASCLSPCAHKSCRSCLQAHARPQASPCPRCLRCGDFSAGVGELSQVGDHSQPLGQDGV
ncbi:hypothetical protein [Cyanobium sp. To12R1]|uniref:hypothetical protein n=1 Tax=Cyanobium sp. To12R1 TaxID=2823723 RepID=UPI0037C023D7